LNSTKITQIDLDIDEVMIRNIQIQ